MAASSMNDIKARIKSVTNTMQITKAMELVASSKLRRAKQKAENSRAYHKALANTINRIRSIDETYDTVFAERRSNPKTCFIVVAGDRGLAGGFNNNVFRLADAISSHLTDDKRCFIPIGKKAIEHYEHKGATIINKDYELVAPMGVGDTLALGKLVTEMFISGEIDRVEIVYTKFVSMLSQVAVHKRLLPFEPVKNKEGKENSPVFDGDPEDILNAIVPEYMGGSIYIAIAESVASECGARRTAMNSANKNASEMIDGLTLRYNRARQAVITQEITEIVSGAEAL